MVLPLFSTAALSRNGYGPPGGVLRNCFQPLSDSGVLKTPPPVVLCCFSVNNNNDNIVNDDNIVNIKTQPVACHTARGMSRSP